MQSIKIQEENMSVCVTVIDLDMIMLSDLDILDINSVWIELQLAACASSQTTCWPKKLGIFLFAPKIYVVGIYKNYIPVTMLITTAADDILILLFLYFS